MRVFDQKLKIEFHKWRAEQGLKIYEAADLMDIDWRQMYLFTSGRSPLKGEDVKKMMDTMNINLEFKPKEQ